jgi:hypothetical protein
MKHLLLGAATLALMSAAHLLARTGANFQPEAAGRAFLSGRTPGFRMRSGLLGIVSARI